ncbi:MAG: hypothetical protein ACJA0V_000833 [Planctomycetota bacterium]|jgi:hypothetical protein
MRRRSATLEIAILRAPSDAKAAILTTVEARRMGIGSDQTIAAMTRAAALGADSKPLLAALGQATISPEEQLALRSDGKPGEDRGAGVVPGVAVVGWAAWLTVDRLFAGFVSRYQSLNSAATSDRSVVISGFELANSCPNRVGQLFG